MSRMTYMQSWKSLRLTSHTWLGLNPQIGRPLSRIVVPLVYFFLILNNQVKYLGVILDIDLNWKFYIDNRIRKASIAY
jgi:hypothetical protein